MTRNLRSISIIISFLDPVYGGFSERKIPHNTVVIVDFADLECEASAKTAAVGARREQ